MVLESVRQAVEFLSDKYGFDGEEAMHTLKISRKEVETKPKKERKSPAPKRVKPSIPLPFCGKIFEDACFGIRANHGLHTQCNNAKVSGCDYCKTCGVQAATNCTDKPNTGDIRDRSATEWVPVSKIVSYGNVMEKLGISREEAVRVSAEFGMTIPDEQFAVVKGRRGRPKKDPSASSSDDDDKPKRPRGRPKSSKKVVSTSSGDDLIAQLVASAQATTTSDSDSDSSMTTQSSQKSPTVKTALKAVSPTVKAALKAEKDAAKVALKAKKDAAKAALKAEKDAAKAALKAEKDAAKAALKAEKDAAKAALKAKKDAAKVEKDAAKAALKAEKDAAKAALKEEEDAAKAKKVDRPTLVAVNDTDNDDDLDELQVDSIDSDDEESESELTVEPFEFNGKTYLKDDDGEVYDPDAENKSVGQWDEDAQTIEFIA
jgi:hypothetical protein